MVCAAPRGQQLHNNWTLLAGLCGRQFFFMDGASTSSASDLLAENERLRETIAQLRAGLQSGHAQLAESLQALLLASSTDEQARAV